MTMKHKKNKHIMYICAARNFLARDPGRKIFSVVEAWKQSGYIIDHQCGGDYTDLNNITDQQTRELQAHRRRENKAGWKLFVLNSLSEFKDIMHDFKMYVCLLRSKKIPDIIWERSSRLHQTGLRLAQKYNRPYVLEWKDHLISYRCSLFIYWARRVEHSKLTQARYIVVESNVLREYLVSQFSVDSNKIIVAHNAVDIEAFDHQQSQQKCRQKYNISQDKLVIGYIGSYAFYHQCDLMVELARNLLTQNIELIMVGTGKEYDQVRSLAEQYQVNNRNLFFLPRVPKEQVPELLVAFDIALLPGSTDIICPIKVQEYMAMGLATLAPDYACNREIINDGIDGLLFEPSNVNDLVSKIELLKENSLRQKLGTQARQHMADNFSWSKTWVQALDHITGNC